jgi:REP element-mobilizing transposase RayT
VQHFISRIAGGEFRITGTGERSELSKRLGLAITRTDWSSLAFTWMSNHEHLVAQAGEDAADAFLRPLHTGFAGWLNRREERFGSVYASRPRNVTFSDEAAVAALIAYVHNNPVRAGLVRDPCESRWSTHRAYIGEEPAPPWLAVERGLSICGFTATGNGRANFHDFVRSRSGLPRDPSMTGEEAVELRAKVREDLGPAVELAPAIDSHARPLILKRAGAVLRPRISGRPHELIEAVAAELGLPTGSIQSRSRRALVAEGRRVALLVWTQHWCRPAAELAPALGITPQACSKALTTATSSRRTQEIAARVATPDPITKVD